MGEYVQRTILRDAEPFERDMSCNGCRVMGTVEKVLEIGSNTSAFEWRMCAGCAHAFVVEIVESRHE